MIFSFPLFEYIFLFCVNNKFKINHYMLYFYWDEICLNKFIKILYKHITNMLSIIKKLNNKDYNTD